MHIILIRINRIDAIEWYSNMSMNVCDSPAVVEAFMCRSLIRLLELKQRSVAILRLFFQLHLRLFAKITQHWQLATKKTKRNSSMHFYSNTVLIVVHGRSQAPAQGNSAQVNLKFLELTLKSLKQLNFFGTFILNYWNSQNFVLSRKWLRKSF